MPKFSHNEPFFNAFLVFNKHFIFTSIISFKHEDFLYMSNLRESSKLDHISTRIFAQLALDSLTWTDTYAPDDGVGLRHADGDEVLEGREHGVDLAELVHGDAAGDHRADQHQAVGADQINEVG